MGLRGHTTESRQTAESKRRGELSCVDDECQQIPIPRLPLFKYVRSYSEQQQNGIGVSQGCSGPSRSARGLRILLLVFATRLLVDKQILRIQPGSGHSAGDFWELTWSMFGNHMSGVEPAKLPSSSEQIFPFMGLFCWQWVPGHGDCQCSLL